MVLTGQPGAGKTTVIRRVAYDLARDGKIVFALRPQSSVDIEPVVACLKTVTAPFILLFDSVAEHAHAIRALSEHPQLKERFVVLGAERDYREEHVDRVMGDLGVEYAEEQAWPEEKYLELIERYRKNGLLGSSTALRNPNGFAARLKGDSAAVAVCRILNDFRPLETIVKSLWNDADEAARRSYLLTALAHHCHPHGLYFPILQAAQRNPELEDQATYVHALPICWSPDDDDYVIPLNPVVADRVLALVAREKRDILLEVFCKLGDALAPYVNRRAIINQTPEARLAGRLFDSDKVVRPMLGDASEKFYAEVKESWVWNSRYWEQRALLIQQRDLNTAIQYARHAIAIDPHPYPWTTLANLLVKKMDVESGARDSLFNEAYDLLVNALAEETTRTRKVGPHAFIGLFHAASKVTELGGQLSSRQKQAVDVWMSDAKHRFSRDPKVQAAITRLESLLQAGV
jgi:hypothetical protein